MSLKRVTQRQIISFQKKIWDYYKKEGRELPWRKGKSGGSGKRITPYHILVSEIMLQQTQVGRVLVKYPQFIAHFPNFAVLAKASTADVLREWQGLGYNRRALALKAIAKRVTGEFKGNLPKDPLVLETFPSIGPATASSIVTFALNIPTPFIETNVRSVFIHFFFREHGMVDDKELLPLIEQALEKENPREWYFALMDYGTMLKERYPNPNRRSAHYTKQSPFKDSDRYIRGQIIKILTEQKEFTLKKFSQKIDREQARIAKCLVQLEDEGFVVKVKQKYSLVL